MNQPFPTTEEARSVSVCLCVCLRCGLAYQRAGPQLPSGRKWRRELQLAHPPAVRAKCATERPSFPQSLIKAPCLSFTPATPSPRASNFKGKGIHKD